MTIEEGNKIIAQFMADNNWIEEEFQSRSVENTNYHNNWDWLMPVVEKISEEHDVSISSVGMWACYIDRRYSDQDDSIADFGGFEPMIMNVWKAVVGYIAWRNLQPKYKLK